MKKRRGILFLICLAGGVLFGVLFFAAFGAEVGYDWTLAWICAGGGLFFAVAFFVVWLIVQKFAKPITFEDLGAQNRLQENEKLLSAYEARFHARIPMGKGLKSAVCETYFYLLPEKLRISYSYFRKIYTFEVAYTDLRAEIDEDGFFYLEGPQGSLSGRIFDEAVEMLRGRLKEKGVLVETAEPFPDI